MNSKRFQIDLSRIVTGILVFVLVIAFLGTFLEYQGTSFGEVFQKVGAYIYDFFYAINSDAIDNISGTPKGRVGWALSLVVITLVVIYNVFLERALDGIFGHSIDEHTKKQFLTVLTIVFVGFIIISPVFNWVVDVANYMLGGATIIGIILFISGLGMIMAGTLIKKGFSLLVEGISTIFGGIAKVRETIKKEELDLHGLMKNLNKEIEQLDTLEKIIARIISSLKHIRDTIRQPGVEVKNIESEKKELANILSILTEEERVVNELLKEKVTDEKIEKAIETLFQKEGYVLNNILSDFRKKYQGIDWENVKEIIRKNATPYIKNFIHEEKRFRKLLNELEKIDQNVKNMLESLRGDIHSINNEIRILLHHYNIDVARFSTSLNNIITALEGVKNKIDKIKKMEIQEDNIVNALNIILNEEREIIEKIERVLKEIVKLYRVR